MHHRTKRSLLIAGLAALAFATAWVVCHYPRATTPELLVTQARAAISEGRWSQAESVLDRLSRTRAPTSADTLVRAELELARGRVDRSVELLSCIPHGDPQAASARLIAGQIELRRHRAIRAETLLQEALSLDPTLDEARRGLIFLFGMQARRAELNNEFRALSRSVPLTFDDVLLWTVSLEDIWINDTILAVLQKYLEADPDDRISRLALAEVWMKIGDLDSAASTLKPLPGSDVEARVLRARLALARLELDEVRALVSDCRADHVGLSLLRGQLALRSNDRQTAEREFWNALRQDPGNREAMQGLSGVLQLSGRAEEAASYRIQADRWRALTDLLQKVNTAGGPSDRVLLKRLGAACEALGRVHEGRAWYQLALGIDPLDAELQQALYRLRERSP
jgi:tetratricopeptide (TPR) repeat protein